MNLWMYLKDKFLLVLLHFVCMGTLAVFLRITKYPVINIILILIVWLLILCIWLMTNFLERRKFFRESMRILEEIDQRYLLGELLPTSFRLDDRLYRELIRKSNKSVIERIHQIEDRQRDYKEYIESWVHEIKAPITCISSICENRRKSGDNEYGTISQENQRIENYVDMVLYYARSEEVYKDYLICETNLQDAVCEVLSRNRLLLIQNKISADVKCGDTAYTDKKWIAFILNQLILNSVKYRSDTPFIRIYTKRTEQGVLLYFEDNGAGIRPEELPRIFDKGFTGSNGRSRERSTGMGLYLCRKLCDRLGIGIRAESEYGQGTRIILEFPVSNYINA